MPIWTRFVICTFSLRIWDISRSFNSQSDSHLGVHGFISFAFSHTCESVHASWHTLVAHILSHAPNLGCKPQARVMINVLLIKNIWKCLGSKFVNKHHQHMPKPPIWLLLHAKLFHQGLSRAQKCWFWRFMYFAFVN